MLKLANFRLIACPVSIASLSLTEHKRIQKIDKNYVFASKELEVCLWHFFNLKKKLFGFRHPMSETGGSDSGSPLIK